MAPAGFSLLMLLLSLTLGITLPSLALMLTGTHCTERIFDLSRHKKNSQRARRVVCASSALDLLIIKSFIDATVGGREGRGGDPGVSLITRSGSPRRARRKEWDSERRLRKGGMQFRIEGRLTAPGCRRGGGRHHQALAGVVERSTQRMMPITCAAMGDASAAAVLGRVPTPTMPSHAGSPRGVGDSR